MKDFFSSLSNYGLQKSGKIALRYYDKDALNYKSHFYNGEIIHIIPNRRYKVHSTELADWNSVVKSVKIINLHSYEAGMLVEPIVKKLASIINDIILKEEVLDESL